MELPINPYKKSLTTSPPIPRSISSKDRRTSRWNYPINIIIHSIKRSFASFDPQERPIKVTPSPPWTASIATWRGSDLIILLRRTIVSASWFGQVTISSSISGERYRSGRCFVGSVREPITAWPFPCRKPEAKESPLTMYVAYAHRAVRFATCVCPLFLSLSVLAPFVAGGYWERTRIALDIISARQDRNC